MMARSDYRGDRSKKGHNEEEETFVNSSDALLSNYCVASES